MPQAELQPCILYATQSSKGKKKKQFLTYLYLKLDLLNVYVLSSLQIKNLETGFSYWRIMSVGLFVSNNKIK